MNAGLWDDQGRVIATMLPLFDGAYDLGSPTLRFRNLYLSGEPVFEDLNLTGNLTFTKASAEIIPGATSLLFKNHADSADNVVISDAGVVTVRAGLIVTAGNINAVNGNLLVSTIGKGLQVKTGTNAKSGTFTANGSTPVVVSNTSVTTNSQISFSLKTLGGTPATVFFTALTAGASFTVNSVALNTSVYNYVITELIP